MASPVRADGDAQVEQPVEVAPAASGEVEVAAPEAPVGGTSTTLTTFPFKNEDLLRVQARLLVSRKPTLEKQSCQRTCLLDPRFWS